MRSCCFKRVKSFGDRICPFITAGKVKASHCVMTKRLLVSIPPRKIRKKYIFVSAKAIPVICSIYTG